MSGYRIGDQEAVNFITFAVVEWVDVFTRQAYSNIIIKSLSYCQEVKDLEIFAWCLMSNHIHLIVRSKSGNLSGTLRDFKKFTSKAIIQAIEENKTESRRKWMLWIFKSAGEKNKRNKIYQFWRQDNHAIELTSNHFIEQKLDYIHNNPVEAGIVDNPEEYIFSSARNYSSNIGLLNIVFLIKKKKLYSS